MRVLSIEEMPDDDVRITVQHAWPFGLWPHTRQYVGSCTVWHAYPSGNRCSTSMESFLCDRWTAWNWKKKMSDARICATCGGLLSDQEPVDGLIFSYHDALGDYHARCWGRLGRDGIAAAARSAALEEAAKVVDDFPGHQRIAAAIRKLKT